jgi:hypothetical protein
MSERVIVVGSGVQGGVGLRKIGSEVGSILLDVWEGVDYRRLWLGGGRTRVSLIREMLLKLWKAEEEEEEEGAGGGFIVWGHDTWLWYPVMVK